MRSRSGLCISILAMMVATCFVSAQAGELASQPANGFTQAQQNALDELIRSLEALRADEKSLPVIQSCLSRQREELDSQLRQADVRIQELQSQLEVASQKRARLATRLQVVQAGNALLGTSGKPDVASPVAAAQPATSISTDPNVRFFAEQVRPVLLSQCYNCHGGQFRKGGLDLSTREGLVKGGETGAAIEVGKSKESLLYKLITHTQDPHMPAKADKLPDETITKIAKWIDAGASYDGPLTVSKQAGGATSQPSQAAATSQHWAFKPPVRREPPRTHSPEWVRNPIDAFVLAKLEAAGLKPSPETDRRTLMRRLSLDLLGLLPKPSEVEDFVRDARPDAYERLVDRFLASPHYGERWGRHWLDLARYADSDGYEKDPIRPYAWRWRDWVIDAVNHDMPFDEFTIEQLAGDLLPNAALEQKVATGFHRNTLTNTEGGVDVEEYRVKGIKDRASTTGTVWLGLTVGCAECHTHKYDPISQREFYQFMAFFNTGQEINQPAPLPRDVDSYNKAKIAFDAERARLQANLAAFDKEELPKRQAEWEARADSEPEWIPLRPVFASSSKGATLTVQKDDSVLAGGATPNADSYTLVFRTDLTGITALKIEALADPSLPSKGPGRAANGNFVLTEVKLTVTDQNTPDGLSQPYRVSVSRAAADHFQADRPFRAEETIDGKPGTGWAILPEVGKDHALFLETGEDVGRAGGVLLSVVLDHDFGSAHAIGRVRVSATTAARPVNFNVPGDVRAILKVAVANRDDKQKARIVDFWRTIDPQRARLVSALDEQARTEPPVPLAQMLVENPKPPHTHIMIKGDFLRLGDEVQPGVLSVLHPFKPRGAKADRLDLARWLVDPANPLTARVAVNRIWQYLFGQAIVTTTNDFGTRSDPPSHPELLDWLATEMIARGWSQKSMIKLMVTSATYRQSSKMRPELIEKDPKNTLLARQARYRIEAEIVRDIGLAAGGLLNEAIGGPSIRPPLPSDVMALAIYGIGWPESKGAERYRRGMYIFFQRAVPYPMLMTFDAPDSNVSCTRRERSNSPLQSLVLLNDGEFFQCAQELGLRALQAGAPPAQVDHAGVPPIGRLVADTRIAQPRAVLTTRPAAHTPPEAGLAAGIRLIYQTCLSREPDTFEILRLSELWGQINQLCQKDATAAAKIVGSPKAALAPAGLPGAAAWIALARTVMNLDEFVTRE